MARYACQVPGCTDSHNGYLPSWNRRETQRIREFFGLKHDPRFINFWTCYTHYSVLAYRCRTYNVETFQYEYPEDNLLAAFPNFGFNRVVIEVKHKCPPKLKPLSAKLSKAKKKRKTASTTVKT